MKLLNEMKIPFVMPAKRNQKVVKASLNDKDIITDRIIKGEKVAKLVVTQGIRDGKKTTMYYSTNMPVTKETIKNIQEIYATRWNIETGFNQIEYFRVRTTSQDTFIRTFYYSTASIMNNLWILTNLVSMILVFKVIAEKPAITKKRFTKILQEADATIT
jgi:IS4 transposase